MRMDSTVATKNLFLSSGFKLDFQTLSMSFKAFQASPFLTLMSLSDSSTQVLEVLLFFDGGAISCNKCVWRVGVVVNVVGQVLGFGTVEAQTYTITLCLDYCVGEQGIVICKVKVCNGFLRMSP